MVLLGEVMWVFKTVLGSLASTLRSEAGTQLRGGLRGSG